LFRKVLYTVVVLEDVTPNFVLGMNFLVDNQAHLHFNTKPPLLTLFDEMFEIPLRPRCDDTNCASVRSTTVVPAYSEAYLTVKTPKRFNNSSVLLENAEHICSISVAGALAYCQHNTAICKILKMNPYTVTLKPGMKLARVLGMHNITSIQKCEHDDIPHGTDNILLESTVPRSVLDQFHKDYGFKINPALDEEKRYEALQLLYRYKSVFARSLAEIKECKGPSLELELYSQQKSFKRQFRLNEMDKIEVNRQIGEMEKIGVIEPSSSAYYKSPIFLVGKRDGSKRLVIDLRGVNSLIVPKLVQLPQIEEMLDEITAEKPQYITISDVSSAFWQIRLNENSRDLTSFTAPDGRRWRFTCSPFGLNNSPSSLQKCLSLLFADKTRFKNLLVYIDDVCIFTNTWQSHMEQLETALQVLHEANISLSPRKTQIAAHEVEYLGHRISGESVRMTEKHIEAIGKIQAPKNLKGLQRLLGMVNYWRKLIPQFSTKTYNMRKLLRKDVPFKWTPQCEAELTYLKNCLVTDPILKPIDPNKEIVIFTDASVYGLGYCIMQKGENDMLHAVKYGSHATTHAQSNYSADDLEATALVYALKSVEWLAQTRPTTVITDNSRVLHIKDWSPSNRRQKRMLTYVMQFPLSVVYIRRSKNLLPDTLSRLWQDATPEERKLNESPFLQTAEDFIVPLTRQATAASRQCKPDKSKPSCSKLLNPYAKTYKPINPTCDSRIPVGDCVKVSASKDHPSGNGDTFSGPGPISLKIPYTLEDDALKPPQATSGPSLSAPATYSAPGIQGPSPEPAEVMPPATHATPVPRPNTEEACRSEIDRRDPLYQLLVKQAAEDYWASTDTARELTPGVQQSQPVADISTAQNISEARPTEFSNQSTIIDNSEIESTERQHVLHGSADQSLPIANNGSESAILPTIGPSDYENDEEFGTMYQYLKYDTLTGNARQDKTILIMAERYIIDEDNLLYRMDTPRQKRLAKLKPIMKRLCIPRRFRHDIIAFFHDQCGHYSSDMLFSSLSANFYWKSLCRR